MAVGGSVFSVEISTHTPVRVWRKLNMLQNQDKISTHTPVRVWRHFSEICAHMQEISTHTPVRVWLVCLSFGNCHCLFQLTHPWGCDYWIPKRRWEEREDFNSHTREGVTCWTYRSCSWLFQFQLTHPWGCDMIDPQYTSRRCNISTHTPVRVWPIKNCDIIKLQHFNSHTREGVTNRLFRHRGIILNFNSHTREGVTISVNYCYRNRVISTHTPVRVWP